MSFDEFSAKVKADFIVPKNSIINKDNNKAKDYYFNLKNSLKESSKSKKKNKNANTQSNTNTKNNSSTVNINTVNDINVEKYKETENIKISEVNNQNNKLDSSEKNVEKKTDSSRKFDLSSTEKEKYYIFEKDEKKIVIPKDLNFGTHSNFSLYEHIARELVFQIFDYPEMGFFQYNFEFKKNEITDKIINWLDSPVNKETYLIDYLDKCFKSKDKEGKHDIKSNDDGEMIDIHNKISNLIKNSCPNYTENLKIKSDNAITNDKFHGDFDFIIPKINSDILKSIFNNQKISSFIFFGNIDVENNQDYDIIGEIKEGADNHKKLQCQIKKHIEMISHFSD